MESTLPLSDRLSEVIGKKFRQRGNSDVIYLEAHINDNVTQKQLAHIARLQVILKDVLPKALGVWDDILLWEMPLEEEISMMECIAVVYLELTTITSLNLEEKEILYRLLWGMVCDGGLTEGDEERVPTGLPSTREISNMLRKEFERVDLTY